MKVVRKQTQWVKFEALTQGQRFRAKDTDREDAHRSVVWQKTDYHDADEGIWCVSQNGYQRRFSNSALVELVKGRWVPEEGNVIQAMSIPPNVVFEFEEKLFMRVITGHGNPGFVCLNNAEMADFSLPGTTVPVVKCTIVEDESP